LSGGESRVVLLAQVAPTAEHASVTRSTLAFAQSVSQVDLRRVGRAAASVRQTPAATVRGTPAASTSARMAAGKRLLAARQSTVARRHSVRGARTPAGPPLLVARQRGAPRTTKPYQRP